MNDTTEPLPRATTELLQVIELMVIVSVTPWLFEMPPTPVRTRLPLPESVLFTRGVIVPLVTVEAVLSARLPLRSSVPLSDRLRTVVAETGLMTVKPDPMVTSSADVG